MIAEAPSKSTLQLWVSDCHHGKPIRMGNRRIGVFLALATASALLGQQPPYTPYPQPYPQYPAQPYPGQGPQAPEPQDQPGQPVARLAVINGEASVRRGDSGDWVAAVVNAPLMAGDSLSVAPSGSVEIQLDYANFVRIGGDSEVRISQLDNGRQQIQVSRGLVTWHVLRDENGPAPQTEISTPSVAVRPLRLSEVRAEVAADGGTRVIVRHGDAEVSTPHGNERVHEGSMMLVRGTTDNPEYQIVYAPAKDGWDSFNEQRDAYLEKAQSNVGRYLSPDIYGGEDLSQNGRWGYDPMYGNVWTPDVPPTWAPYQNGDWTWNDYYGWTWVDYDPWGWAPFHYGSWYLRTGFGWSWVPGARYGHYWYHPAMVGFFGFGGPSFGVGFGFANVGWVALAPFEAFHPWYGPGWFAGGRLGLYNNVVYNTNIVGTFRNARVANGVVAVSAADFEHGAFRNQIAVNRAQLAQGSLVRGALPITPTGSNLRFSDRAVAANAIPRNAAANQRFFSRMPAASTGQRPSFAQQQAAVRSAFGGAGSGGRAAQVPAGDSGWRRFGEPAGAMTQPRAQSGGSNGRPSAAGWNGFGTPQRSAAPQQGRLPPVIYGGGSSYQGGRAVQVAPPMVQQRSAPAPGYRSAPAPSNRGGGGGNRSTGSGHSSGGHSGGGHR